MLNSDGVFISVAKTIAIAGIGAIGGGMLTLSGWIWTGSAWKTEVDIKLDNLATNYIRLEGKVDKGFDKMDKKMDRNFDLLITEMRLKSQGNDFESRMKG